MNILRWDLIHTRNRVSEKVFHCIQLVYLEGELTMWVLELVHSLSFLSQSILDI